MRLMKRVRDGKVAAYEPSCIESGRWEEVIEMQKGEHKPRAKRGPRPLILRTTDAQVSALFDLPFRATETQKESA